MNYFTHIYSKTTQKCLKTENVHLQHNLTQEAKPAQLCTTNDDDPKMAEYGPMNLIHQPTSNSN